MRIPVALALVALAALSIPPLPSSPPVAEAAHLDWCTAAAVGESKFATCTFVCIVVPGQTVISVGLTSFSAPSAAASASCGNRTPADCADSSSAWCTRCNPFDQCVSCSDDDLSPPASCGASVLGTEPYVGIGVCYVRHFYTSTAITQATCSASQH